VLTKQRGFAHYINPLLEFLCSVKRERWFSILEPTPYWGRTKATTEKNECLSRGCTSTTPGGLWYFDLWYSDLCVCCVFLVFVQLIPQIYFLGFLVDNTEDLLLED